eukprot:3331921-Amphidinium_carterae.2
MQTANGIMEADKRATERVNTLRYSFHWEKGTNPYLIDKGGRRIDLSVERYIPYLDDTALAVARAQTHSGDIDIRDVTAGDDVLDTDIALTGRSRKVLAEEARTKEHQLTHLPKSPFCHTCAGGKAINTRSPRPSGSELYKQTKKFGDIVTVDHAIAQGAMDFGIECEKAMVVLLGVATRWLLCYLTCYQDHVLNNAAELVQAAESKAWVREKSIPGQPRNNALDERMGYTLSEWPYAAKSLCLMNTVMKKDGNSSWLHRFENPDIDAPNQGCSVNERPTAFDLEFKSLCCQGRGWASASAHKWLRNLTPIRRVDKIFSGRVGCWLLVRLELLLLCLPQRGPCYGAGNTSRGQ